jgi:hypothetical protein
VNIKHFLAGAAAGALMLGAFAAPAFAAQPVGKGFDQYGYNLTALIFNGTGSSWCLAGGQAATCVDPYGNDNLVMKWNAAWDACNAAGNNDVLACLGAWTDNEWNGNVPGGSGVTEHYKIIWVGSAGTASPYWVAGGYSVWGNYEVIMDQGTDTTGHFWIAHGIPNGYGGN